MAVSSCLEFWLRCTVRKWARGSSEISSMMSIYPTIFVTSFGEIMGTWDRGRRSTAVCSPLRNVLTKVGRTRWRGCCVVGAAFLLRPDAREATHAIDQAAFTYADCVRSVLKDGFCVDC